MGLTMPTLDQVIIGWILQVAFEEWDDNTLNSVLMVGSQEDKRCDKGDEEIDLGESDR